MTNGMGSKTFSSQLRRLLLVASIIAAVYAIQYQKNSTTHDAWWTFHPLLASAQQETPTPVELYDPTEVTDTSMRLTWSRNVDEHFYGYVVVMVFGPLQNLSLATGAEAEWMEWIGDQSVVSYEQKWLQPSTTYHFAIAVCSTQEQYSFSNVVSVTTRAYPPITSAFLSSDILIATSILIAATVTTGFAILKSKHSWIEGASICVAVGLLNARTSTILIGAIPQVNTMSLGGLLGGLLASRYDSSQKPLRRKLHLVVGASVGCVAGWYFLSFGILLAVTGFYILELEHGGIVGRDASEMPQSAYSRFYFLIALILGVLLTTFTFYILKGQTLLRLDSSAIIFPSEMNTILIAGIIIGAIFGIIPGINIIFAILMGIIIGLSGQALVYDLLGRTFFLIPIFSVLAIFSARRIEKKYNHTTASRGTLVLLYPVMTLVCVNLLGALNIPVEWAFIVALLLWFPASLIVVEAVASRQDQLRETRRIQKTLENVTSDLSKVESEISGREKNLQKLQQKHEEPLRKREALESQVRKLVASDPRNLPIKAEEIRKRAQKLSEKQIQTEIGRINREIARVRGESEKNEKEMILLKKEAENLILRRRETELKLKKLRLRDARNVQVAIETLEREWGDLNQSDLENVTVSGKVAPLFKTLRLIDFQRETKEQEIEALQSSIMGNRRTNIILNLERLTLQEERAARDLGRDSPRFVTLSNELRRLKAEQRDLTKRKARAQTAFDRLRSEKPQLQVGRPFLVALGLVFVGTILLFLVSHSHLIYW